MVRDCSRGRAVPVSIQDFLQEGRKRERLPPGPRSNFRDREVAGCTHDRLRVRMPSCAAAC